MALLQLSSGSTSIPIEGKVLPVRFRPQTVQAIRTGPEVQREARTGINPFAYNDMSGGLMTTSQTQDWQRDKNRIYKSDGGRFAFPSVGALPFKTTLQTALAAVDISGYRAANKRVHAVQSNLGAAYNVIYYLLGPNLYKPTSSSNPALIPPATADNISDGVLSAVETTLAGTRGLLISTDGTTSDTRITADPTADSISWTEAITHAAGEGAWAMWDFPHLRHLVLAGLFNGDTTARMYYIPYDATLPATPNFCPAEESKDVPNPNNATVTLGPNNPTIFAQMRNGSHTQTGSAVIVSDITADWATPASAASSNNSYATHTPIESSAAVVYLSPKFILSGYGFTPADAAVVVGSTFSPEVKESNADDNQFWANSELDGGSGIGGLTVVKDGAPTSYVYTPSTSEIPTTDTTQAVGSSTLTLAPLTGADVKNSGFGVALQFINDSASTTPVGSVDACPITLYVKPPGFPVYVNKGGYGKGRTDPTNANRFHYCQPNRDEATTVLLNRELWAYVAAYDPDGARIGLTQGRVNAQLPHVEDWDYYLGGIAAAGGNVPGGARQLKLIGSDGVARNLPFDGIHGSTAVRIMAVKAHGVALYMWVANADGTDLQKWMYYDGKMYPEGVLWSKPNSGALANLPLAFAEHPLDTYQNQIRAFVPFSTNTGVGRQFYPDDPLSNPMVVHSAEVKADGPLTTQGVRLNVMPEESLKTLLMMQYQNTELSSTNTVTYSVNTDGDYAFASNEVSRLFDDASAGTATYTDYNIVSSNDPGVAFKTMMVKFALTHSAGGAGTPNAFPMLFFISAQHKALLQYRVYLDEAGQRLAPIQMLNQIQTAQNSKQAFRLFGGGFDDVVQVEDFNFIFKRTVIGKSSPTWADVNLEANGGPWIEITQLVGSTAA